MNKALLKSKINPLLIREDRACLQWVVVKIIQM